MESILEAVSLAGCFTIDDYRILNSRRVEVVGRQSRKHALRISHRHQCRFLDGDDLLGQGIFIVSGQPLYFVYIWLAL